MPTPIERLISLLEFARQSALLKVSPPLQVAQHKQFSLYEGSLAGLPGIMLNTQVSDVEEVWLRIERLRESPLPVSESKLLELWIEHTKNPAKEPTLKSAIERHKLVEIGVLSATELDTEVPAPITVTLQDFPGKAELTALFKSHLATTWRPWSEREILVRRSIALYSELFLLSQQLQGELLDNSLELAWGVGMGCWASPTGTISYPVLTQLVEISLDEKTMALEVRPRAVEPQLEVEAYAAMDNPNVSKLVDAARKLAGEHGLEINPFAASTFEPLLKSAAALLDSSGIYWPTQVSASDRTVPKPGEHLAVTDTWVLFARPRTKSLFIQDMIRFEALAKKFGDLDIPGAIRAIVTDPSSELREVNLPSFRGLSFVGGHADQGGKPAELYFPKPYNEEQVQIIQMLEVYDGVVVQGPPGTGKTHTIANVICHYLAQGKRVLVTSMKDPALAVLQEKLPEAIQPLAVSLLTSEANGMRQFEFAINQIAAEITRIDKRAYRTEIEELDGQIDALHGQIASTDKAIAQWARRNLETINIENEEITPVAAAQEVVAHHDVAPWFSDELTIGTEHTPRFDNEDINALREARRSVGEDLAYIGASLPQITSFPDTEKLLQAHQDLSRHQELVSQETVGTVPSLCSNSPDVMERAMATASRVSNLRLLLQEIDSAQQGWTASMRSILRKHGPNEVLELFTALCTDLEQINHARREFLARPVTCPEGIDSNTELVEAFHNLSLGQSAFGLAGLFGKTDQKRIIESIQVVGTKPANEADWGHVLRFLEHQARCRSLLVRWNALAGELPLPRIEPVPGRVIEALAAVELYHKLRTSIDQEGAVGNELRVLLPGWMPTPQPALPPTVLAEAEAILTHHLTRSRLAQTWVLKERFASALAGCNGAITGRIREFLDNDLGNPSLSIGDIQSGWSALMEELRRAHQLAPHLEVIRRITDMVEASGGEQWAGRLRTSPLGAIHDELLPDNWRAIWRLARLTHFVTSIDARRELPTLSRRRSDLEGDLAKHYRDAVTKRTWLRLAENATPDVRAALEAYRLAIKKIGKGTGVRAARYRHDARQAAEKANAVIPCWIMPHYRISESLPAQFGSFDLVIIDEASQSDLTALPALLRARKVLIVGDDKQVSPEGVGLEEEKLRQLMTRFLSNQVEIYRPQMSPERSIYDLFKVAFADSAVMLREHFRCVAPIIEYSKREFYNHQLRPLRMPRASERLDPPLVDVFVLDGFRNRDLNTPEARFIVDEIARLTQDPAYANRTIGVVSLLGSEQALQVMKMITDHLGEQIVTRHKITCGDARTFQGKERDVMFLSMVVSADNCHAQGTEMFAQRFNVAASRAKDRMYLVRSVQIEDLSSKDILRIKLMQHFQSPFLQSEEEVTELRDLCESPFEREVFDFLTERGYRVVPQVPVGSFRIDMIVEGENDNRLAIECDGDRYHGPEQWQHDMNRQRILERAGLRFWRCFASTFVMYREQVETELLTTLAEMDIHPSASDGARRSIHTELRPIRAYPQTEKEAGMSGISEEAGADNAATVLP